MALYWPAHPGKSWRVLDIDQASAAIQTKRVVCPSIVPTWLPASPLHRRRENQVVRQSVGVNSTRSTRRQRPQREILARTREHRGPQRNDPLRQDAASRQLGRAANAILEQ